MSFPLPDSVADSVEALLVADATTGTVSWTRGEITYDDPLQVPVTDAYGDMTPLGFVLAHDVRMQPKYMGGISPDGHNLSSWLGSIPVQVTMVARSQAKDTQAARRQAEDMLAQVARVLCGGDVSLGGQVMHIDTVTVRADAIPKQGIAWVTMLVEYRFIAAPVP